MKRAANNERLRPVAPNFKKDNTPGERLQRVIEDLFDQHRINSRADFAERVNVPDYVLNRIISGNLTLTPHLAKIIEKEFGVSCNQLIESATKQPERKIPVPAIITRIDENDLIYSFVPDDQNPLPAKVQRLNHLINYLIANGTIANIESFAAAIKLSPRYVMHLKATERVLKPGIAKLIEEAFGLQQEWLIYNIRRQNTTSEIPPALWKAAGMPKRSKGREKGIKSKTREPRPARTKNSIPLSAQRLQKIIDHTFEAGLISSRKDFAQLIGEDYHILCNILIGRVPITGSRVAAWHKLGISPGWLMQGVGKKYLE